MTSKNQVPPLLLGKTRKVEHASRVALPACPTAYCERNSQKRSGLGRLRWMEG